MSVQSQISRISANISGAYSAVADMGGELPGQQNSANLAAAVRSIPAGGQPSAPLDPKEVYKATRPADWLPMPTPQDNEMYLLFHIPDGVSSLLAFTVTCAGDYTVGVGTVSNGQFIQHSASSIASDSKYEAQLFAGDFGNLTGDGMKQCVVKVSGTNISMWKPSTHINKSYPTTFCNWNIVEISCKLPGGISMPLNGLQNLRYFSWYGSNAATTMDSMFDACYSLRAIPELDTSQVTRMVNMFRKCYSLMAIPELDTSQVTTMDGMFNACYSLTTIPELDTSQVTSMVNMFNSSYSLRAIPELDTSQVTSMSNMFGSCYSLTTIPELDTSQVTTMLNMFSSCYSLRTIPELDTSKVSDMYCVFSSCYSLTTIPELDTSKVSRMDYMFNSCYSLAKFILKSTITGWAGCEIPLSRCSLGHQAIVDLFNSLPTITSAKKLTLTGNPGVSELTDAEKAIATGKNWTLTL